MQFKERYTFLRIDQDLAPDKRNTSTHLNITNMEVFLTSRGASLQVAKGTDEITSGATALLTLDVIGHGTIDDELFIFVTHPVDTDKDNIIKVEVTKTSKILTPLYATGNTWGFNINFPIDAVGIVEHDKSEKLYWVDAANQARFVNVKSPTTDVDYVLSNVEPAHIKAEQYAITASKNAVVRYAFTQYNIGGSESKLSPLSNPVNISTDEDSAKVVLTGLTSVYDTYRVYRVMWESYNSAPTYSIVAEGAVDSDSTSVTLIDGGNLLVTNISLEEFIDIGSDLLIPSTLVAKKQRLFFGNYKVDPYKVDADMRAFSYKAGSYTLLAPVAIPANSNIEYVASIDGVLTSARVHDKVLDGTVVTGTIKNFETIEFVVSTSNFYIRSNVTDGLYNVKVYDYSDPSYSNLLTELSLFRVTATPESVEGMDSGSGYRLVLTLDGKVPIDTDVDVNVMWADEIDQELEFYADYDDVPDIAGCIYSGVTGFAATTEVKFREEGDSSYSNYYTPDDIITGTGALAGKSKLEFVFTGGLMINGVRVDNNTLLYRYLKADLLGTKECFDDLTGGGDIGLVQSGSSTVVNYSTHSNIPTDIDAINADTAVYKYQAGAGADLGAEGNIVKLTLSKITNTEELSKQRIFKSGETYRIGIVLYDEHGRSTAAMWVCDLLIPYADSGTSDGYRDFYRLEGELKSIPTGVENFKFVYVKRQPQDKTILFQGVLQPVMEYSTGGTEVGLYPFPNIKELKGNGVSNTAANFGHFDVRAAYNTNIGNGEDFPDYTTNISDTEIYDKRINLIYTPDTHLYKTDLPGTSVRILGTQLIDASKDTTRFEYEDPSGDIVKTKTYNDSSSLNNIRFSMESAFSITKAPAMMFDSYTDDDEKEDVFAIWMYHRSGGAFSTCTQVDTAITNCKYLGVDSITTVDSNVINNTVDEVDFAGKSADLKCNYEAEFSDCFVISTASTTWAGSGANYSNFFVGNTFNGSGALTARAFPIVEVLQNVNKQYGGDTLEAKSMNMYVDASEGIKTSVVNLKVTLFGDTYSGVYYLPKATSTRSLTNGLDASVFDYIKIGMECEIEPALANKLLTDIGGVLNGGTSRNLKLLEVKNLLTYNKVFSQIPNAVLSISRPFNYVEVVQYLNRITVSGSKHSGEVIDNWTKINLGTYMDLESPYGSITKLVRAKDSVFAFQPRGIAYISIFPEKQVQTATGGFQVAKGAVLDNFQYISIDSGTENKQCIAVRDKEVFFIDTVNKTLNTIAEGEVSTLKGFNSVAEAYIKDEIRDYLSAGNIRGGFVVVNNHLKQVLFRFSSEFPMLAYNYVSKQFTNTRTYDGYYFMAFNDYVLSASDSVLYIHDRGTRGVYYGYSESATIEMFIEPVPGVDKIFDAVSVLKNGLDNFDKITITSPTRTSGDAVDLLFDSKYDMPNAFLPRVENSRDRWRERNLKILLEYTGSNSLEIDEIFIKFSVKK